MENTHAQQFFLYVRKSTDVEDKQVLSIDAQLTELRSFAREQGFHIVEEFVEKQSAKKPRTTYFWANGSEDRAGGGEWNHCLAS